MAVPLICGAQVGTCITSLLSSLGTSNNGKRTAFLNLYYNLLKTIPFMVIFYLLNHFIGFSFLEKSVGGIGIPMFHTLVNLCGTAVWLPLAKVIVFLAQKTIPQSEKEKEEEANTLTMLDRNLLAAPSLAIEQADRAVILLSETVGDAFLTASAVQEEAEQIDKGRLLCERSRRYQEQIDAYLVQITSKELGRKDGAAVSLLLTGSAAFGRMGKMAERLLGIIQDSSGLTDKLTEVDRREIRVIGEAIHEIMQVTIRGYTCRTPNLSRTIRYYTEEVMALGHLAKSRYIQRVHEEGRTRIGNTLYTDICYAEEQLTDYCDMIAEALIRYERECGEESAPVDLRTDEMTRQQIREIFRDKFEALESCAADCSMKEDIFKEKYLAK